MNQLFETAFHLAPIGIALAGLDGRWLRVNRALCYLVGYTEAELLARTFQDLTHPDDLGPDLASVGRMLRGEIQQYEMEKRYFHKDGRVVWIQLNVTLARDAQGEPMNFIAHIQGITARKTQEMALQRSHQEKDRRLAELRTAQRESEALRARLLTICAYTKRIRHEGRWMSVDEFLSEHLHLRLTHGLSEEGFQSAMAELEDVERL